jgi:hypothetical protein
MILSWLPHVQLAIFSQKQHLINLALHGLDERLATLVKAVEMLARRNTVQIHNHCNNFIVRPYSINRNERSILY